MWRITSEITDEIKKNQTLRNSDEIPAAVLEEKCSSATDSDIIIDSKQQGQGS